MVAQRSLWIRSFDSGWLGDVWFFCWTGLVWKWCWVSLTLIYSSWFFIFTRTRTHSYRQTDNREHAHADKHRYTCTYLELGRVMAMAIVGISEMDIPTSQYILQF
ncbi:hypothetical protein VTJ04DRAFT_7596 [Mycothermus thermophilus]|uniref:uncharacterized protein n=1 Tax=Humicola insolens TaxID=85995 RepID=UPI003743C50C